MNEPNLKEIVEKYLKENGYAGLTDCDECGCHIDDLMPCDAPNIFACIPGVNWPLIAKEQGVDHWIAPKGKD